MSSIILNNVNPSVADIFNSHKEIYEREITRYIEKRIVPKEKRLDYIIYDDELTAEELAEEEREIEARRPEIERRLKDKKVVNVDIFEFLKDLKASKK